jgi:hypothetical protein
VLGGAGLTESELLLWCRGFLPEFTVPSSFTLLNELPRTVSRKLDRERLPEPVSDDVSVAAEWDPTTSAVADIWSDVLGLEAVPPGGDFFALGGHSLIAMRVIGRVRRVFEMDMSLTTLFDHPTIEDFAAVVAREASPDWQANELDELLDGLADLSPNEAAALLAAIDPDGGG